LKVKEEFLFSHFYLSAGIIKRVKPCILTFTETGGIQ